MTTQNFTINNIERLKRELVDRYILLMIFLLVVYALIFKFFIDDRTLFFYILGGIAFLSYSYLIVRKKYSVHLIVHVYLTLASLYSIYPILFFWESSVVSLCWLIPIPLGANIFFTKKEVLIYTGYLLVLIFAIYLIADTFSFNFHKHTQSQLIISDVVLIISNVLIIFLLLYYKDKIRKQEILLQLEENRTGTFKQKDQKEQKNDNKSVSSNNNDIEFFENLFSRIDESMEENLFFKDSKFNLSSLSAALQVNHYYISKAIHHRGYSNFNAYINNYRVNYVKKLLEETDLQKTTLMYIYTNAGFSNQSTFNRVFKQVEGITPSEYIQKKRDATSFSTLE